MSICLCNHSADEVLEYLAKRGRELTPTATDIASFTVDAVEAQSIRQRLGNALSAPVELLSCAAKKRRSTGRVACHVWNTALPSNSLYLVEEGVYVSSPEFTLLQQASQLHQAELCQMLARYLGTWTPAPEEKSGLKSRAPLTTFDSLQAYMTRAGSVRGTGNLRLAMAYTCEGAASPQESVVQLALSLPPEFNGLALPQPHMNYEVELSPISRRLCGKNSIRIDVCWPQQKFGLEYQGQDHGDRLGEDCARWFAAHEEGYELWLLAKEQVEDAAQLLYIGQEVARRIGAEVNDALWPAENDFQELLDLLRGVKHSKPLSYNALRERRKALRTYRRQCAHDRVLSAP